MGQSHPDLSNLFFSIPKYVIFKKLNGTNGLADMRKFSNLSCLYFIFVFIFIFIFIILKLIYFIKNKNIMNFQFLIFSKKEQHHIL